MIYTRPLLAVLPLILTLVRLSAAMETSSFETAQALALDGFVSLAAAQKTAYMASLRPVPRAGALPEADMWLKHFSIEPADSSKPRERLTIEVMFGQGYALRWLRLVPRDGGAYEVSYGNEVGAYSTSMFEERPFSVSYAYQSPGGIIHHSFVTSVGNHRFDHTGLETVVVHPSRDDDHQPHGAPSIGIRVDGVVSYQWYDDVGGLKEWRLLPGGDMIQFETRARFAEPGLLPPPAEGELEVNLADSMERELCLLTDRECQKKFERLVQHGRFDR